MCSARKKMAFNWIDDLNHNKSVICITNEELKNDLSLFYPGNRRNHPYHRVPTPGISYHVSIYSFNTTMMTHVIIGA